MTAKITTTITTDPLADERHEWDNAEHPVDKLRRVEVARAGAGEAKATLGVRFDPEVIDRLRQMADAQGVGVTQMVRSWVLERVAAEQTAPGSIEEVVDLLAMSLDRLRRIALAG